MNWRSLAVAIAFFGSTPFMAIGQDNKPAAPLAGALKKLDGFPVPQRRIGFVSPLAINDTVPYMFYGAFRDRVMMVTQTLSLAGYDIASARKALGELDQALAGVTKRGAEMIVVGGSVLSFAYDRETLLQRLAAASEKLGVPVTTDMEATVAIMQRAGVRRIAVAHRLNGLDNKALADYLTAAGFSLDGISGPSSPPGSTAQGETAIFAELGIAAGKSFPDADGILFLGGSTVNYPYLAEIQRETSKRVFNNTMGMFDYMQDWIDAHPATTP
ncbi:MAG: aspartate racemase/maleate isomerase family protein [Xanthobacteraceae bacterium]